MSSKSIGRGRRLGGKIIVVTGSGSGMGAAEAAALAAEGAVVIAADIAVATVSRSETLIPYELDVADEAGWRDLAQWIAQRFGRLDGLINNAGITNRDRFDDIGLDDWNKVIAVNLTGPMLGMRELAPLMKEGGSIVNIASIAAFYGHFPPAYTASKWGLRGLSRAASLEFGDKGIRVNTIMPGFVRTGMNEKIPATVEAAMIGCIPAGRHGVPDDLAGLAVFLMSDESGFISGAEIPVDGGQAAHGGMKVLADAIRMAEHAG